MKKLLIGLMALASISAFAKTSTKIIHPTCLIYSAVEKDVSYNRDINNDETRLTRDLKFGVNQLLEERGWKVIQVSADHLLERIKLITQDKSIIEDEAEFYFFASSNLSSFGGGLVEFSMQRFQKKMPISSEIAYGRTFNDKRNTKKLIKDLRLNKLVPACEIQN